MNFEDKNGLDEKVHYVDLIYHWKAGGVSFRLIPIFDMVCIKINFGKCLYPNFPFLIELTRYIARDSLRVWFLRHRVFHTSCDDLS